MTTPWLNNQSQDTVTFLLTTLLALCALTSLVVKFVLIPYLREHLLSPVRETHQQVTENGHVDPGTPTLPDRLATISEKQQTIQTVLNRHVAWSIAEHQRIDRELAQRQEQEDDDPLPGT